MNETENRKKIEEEIDEVLDKIRPFLAREGGNIVLDHFDSETGFCYVNMIGACSNCSLASYDVSESVEVMLMDEIPEIKKVELIQDQISNDYSDLLSKLQEEELATEELNRIKEEREKKNNQSK